MTTPIRAAIIQAGMTHQQAKEAVSLCWPGIALQLFFPTNAYYHDGCSEDSFVDNSYVLRTHRVPGPILLTGDLPLTTFRDNIYLGLGLEPELCHRETTDPIPGKTMNEKQRNAARWPAVFAARYGRPPTKNDPINADLLEDLLE